MEVIHMANIIDADSYAKAVAIQNKLASNPVANTTNSITGTAVPNKISVVADADTANNTEAVVKPVTGSATATGFAGQFGMNLVGGKVTDGDISGKTVTTGNEVKTGMTPEELSALLKKNSDETLARITDIQNKAKAEAEASNAQYLRDMQAKGEAYANSAKQARDALIQSRLTQAVQAEEANKLDAENNLVNETNAINQETYNATENTKAFGQQQGIQYSNQQLALQNGVQANASQSLNKARMARDTALTNIKNKIQALKDGAMSELQASASQAEADKAGYGLKASETVFNRSAQVADANNALAGQSALALQNSNSQLLGQQLGFNHDKEIAKLSADNQIKMKNMDFAQQDKVLKMDEASKKSSSS